MSGASNAVTAFSRDPLTGSLNQLPGGSGCVSQDGTGGFCTNGRGLSLPYSVAVSPDGRNVYVASIGSDGVAAFSRDGLTGTLSQLAGAAGCVTDKGGDGCTDGRGLAGASTVSVSPDGRNVYVAADGGTPDVDGSVAVFSRDASTGALTQLQGTAGCVSETGNGGECSDDRALDGATRVTISNDGKNAYVTSLFSDAVAIFSRDSATGSLSQLAGKAGCISSGGAATCASARALGYPHGITLSPDDRTVYVAAVGSNAVSAFARDPDTGGITQLSGTDGCVADGGAYGCATGTSMKGPIDVAVAPDRRFVYAASYHSGSIGVFKRNRTTGRLQQPPGTDGCFSSSSACAPTGFLTNVSSLTLTPDGLKVYAASPTQDAISNLSVTPSTGVSPSCSSVTQSISNSTPTTVRLACTEPDGDTITLRIASRPGHGGLGRIKQDQGEVVYTPANGYKGADSFTFTGEDVDGKSAPVTVALDVAAPAAEPTPTPGPRVTDPAAFNAGAGINSVWVTDAAANDTLLLVNPSGQVIRQGSADRLGSLIFRGVAPDSGYTVRLTKDGKVFESAKLTVTKPGSNPSAGFYSQTTLKAGLNYVKMRDGTELAMTVRTPYGKPLDPNSTYPTFVEFSDEQAAAPGDLLAALRGGSESDPLLPGKTTLAGSILGQLADFVTVSVQVRGSGCSGGAYDLFDYPTIYDGYDAIETVAAQRWAKGGKVGMVGMFGSGTGALLVAGTRPPHLAAISPLAAADDLYSSVAYPGGIRNEGSAMKWLTDRQDAADPAPTGGQPWARVLASTDPATGKARDQRCLDNQKLRLQSLEADSVVRATSSRLASFYDKRSAATTIARINVPVFWSGTYNDEQSGSHWTSSINGLKSNRKVWVTLENGPSVDALSPSVLTRWVEFMNLYVADRIPQLSSTALTDANLIYSKIAKAAAVPVGQSRFAGMVSSTRTLAAARTQFEKDPRVTVLMENGAAMPGTPGAIGSAWNLGFSAWPIKQTTATRYYLADGGSLTPTKPSAFSAADYVADPSARPADTLGDKPNDAWKAQPAYNWAPVAAGKGLGFITSPLQSDRVLIGPASADLFLRSSAADTDLQVTLSEVRPDGAETYIQTGWLRASARKLSVFTSTPLDPFPTFSQRDAAPLPGQYYSIVRVPIPAFAHAFRTGSRIRLTVTAPGGDRPGWLLDTISAGETNTLSLGGTKASSINLPLINGARIPSDRRLPAPTALRGQPTRAYRSASNGG